MRTLGRITGDLIVLLAAALAAGCGERTNSPTTTGVGSRPLNATQNVLDTFEKSWNDMSAAKYAALLSDDFSFTLAPRDVGHDPSLNWPRSDEVTIAERFFSKTVPNADGYVADAITLGFDHAVTPDHVNGWTRIALTHVALTVKARHYLTGAPIDYRVLEDDDQWLWLAPEGGTWKIMRWEDRPLNDPPGLPSCWGRIKEKWRP